MFRPIFQFIVDQERNETELFRNCEPLLRILNGEHPAGLGTLPDLQRLRVVVAAAKPAQVVEVGLDEMFHRDGQAAHDPDPVHQRSTSPSTISIEPKIATTSATL